MTRSFVFLLFTILISCSDDEVRPIQLVDKKVRIEFFTAKDFTDSRYDEYFIKLNVGALKMTYDPYEEEYFLDETTDWIAFKDIPKRANALVFEGAVTDVDPEKQMVTVGYSYVVKVGDYTESFAKSTGLSKSELAKTVLVNF